MNDVQAAATAPRRPFLRLALFGFTALAALTLLGGVAWRTIEGATRADTPELYARLAETICPTMHPVGAKLRTVSNAEQLAGVRERRATVRGIQQRGAVLAELASVDERNVEAILKLHEEQKGLAPFVNAAALAVFGLATEDASASHDGGRAVLDEGGKLLLLLGEIARIEERHRANLITLAKLAPQFSGPVAERCFLTGEFSESGIFFGPDEHTLTVRHSLETTLHDCMVYIQLVDEDRLTTVNVRFVPEWPAATTLEAKFDAGEFEGATPERIDEVLVRVWAREQSSPGLDQQRPIFGW